MILSDSEVDIRLSSPNNIINKVSIKKPDVNLGNRGYEIPEVVRDLIAVTASESKEKQTDIAKEFKISQPLVSQMSRGLVDSKHDERLSKLTRNIKQEKEDTAHSLALDSLVSVLGELNPKLADVEDPRTLSRIAKDMSSVVKDLNATRNTVIGDHTRVVINMVNMKKESSFEIIDV